jgi:hypothetical protein
MDKQDLVVAKARLKRHALLVLNVSSNNFRASRNKRLDSRKTDAARPSRDDGDFAVKIGHVRIPPVFIFQENARPFPAVRQCPQENLLAGLRHAESLAEDPIQNTLGQ